VVDFLTALVASFGIMFVAELGDKTQLLALNFGSRYPLRIVVAGLTLGYASAGLVAIVVGGVLGANLPRRAIEVVGGLVFLGFAVLALRSDGDHHDHVRSIAMGSAVMTIGVTIFVAEMGDKTQIATATLAARSNLVGTWIGATAGEVTSGMIGAFAGRALGDRVSPAMLRYASALIFAVFGVLMLAGWF
jgi:putative Ca2+/H+ antiporter (TMEM165/GDT1 family)